VVGALLLAGAALAAGLSHGVLLNASIDRSFSHPRPRSDQSGRMGGMRVGDSATLTFTVTADDTAAAMGSGDLPVLATPRLLAWCEATTCAVVEPAIDRLRTSVGTRVQLDHVGASPVGAEVTITASVAHLDGRLVRFDVAALQGEEKLVGHGELTRVVVDRERFLLRV
jgi:fluoroacetyl-CoA thioesterase